MINFIVETTNREAHESVLNSLFLNKDENFNYKYHDYSVEIHDCDEHLFSIIIIKGERSLFDYLEDSKKDFILREVKNLKEELDGE